MERFDFDLDEECYVHSDGVRRVPLGRVHIFDGQELIGYDVRIDVVVEKMLKTVSGGNTMPNAYMCKDLGRYSVLNLLYVPSDA